MQELSQFHESKLLQAIEKMTADGVAEGDIRALVNDYKSRYRTRSTPKVKPAPKVQEEPAQFYGAGILAGVQLPVTKSIDDILSPSKPSKPSSPFTKPKSPPAISAGVDSLKADMDARLKESYKNEPERKAANRKAAIDKLPFSEAELKKSAERGWSIVRTKTGGQLSIGNAIRRWSKATGESGYSGGNPYALDDPKLYYTNFGEIPDPEVSMQKFGGRPFVPSIVENPEKRQPTLSNLPSKIIGGIVQNEAKKHKNLDKQDIKNLVADETSTPLVKTSDEVFNLAKYFVPGVAGAAITEDAALVKTRADEVGWRQAGSEFAQGFAQGFNVFEPGLSPVERTGRVINGLIGMLALSAGAGAALRSGKLKLAEGEVAKAYGVSRAQARELIQGTLDVADLPPIPVAREDFLGQSKTTSANSTNDVMASPETGFAPLPATPSVPGQRLAPDPLPFDGVPKAPSQILADAQRLLNRVVYRGTPSARGALGTYEPANGTRTVIRHANDLDTAAHEIAHALDDQFNIVGTYAGPRKRSPFDKELAPFWVHTSRKNYSLQQKRAEGVAEFVRGYVVNPEEAMRMAPQFFEHFKAKVGDDVMAALDAFGKDIRDYAGASNANKVKANIRFEKPSVLRNFGLSAVQEWFRPKGHGYQTPGVSMAKRMFTDDLDPFVKAVEEVNRRKGISSTLPENDPILLARGFAYFKNKFDNILQHGLVNARNERVGKPFQHILEPLDSSSFDALNKDSQDMLALITAQRTIEKANQTGNKRTTNFGAGIYDSVDVAQGAIKDLMADPVRFARLQESAARYREWADDILQYAVDKGRLSQADFKRIKASNQYYAGMQRVMDDIATPNQLARKGNKIGSKTDAVKRFEGSTREIENPLQNLMEQAYTVIKEADRNEIMVKFRDLLTNKRPMYGLGPDAPIDLASIGHRVPMSQQGESVIIYVKGKAEKWVFEPGIMTALKDVGRIVDFNNPLVKVLEFLPKLMRAAVTHSPGFAIRNRIRDIQDRLIKSRTGSNLGKDTFGKVTAEEINHFSLYGGGVHSSKLLDDAYNYNAVQRKLMKDMVKDKGSILLLPGKALGAYKQIIESGERAGRVAEVRSALRKAEAMGLDEYNAQLLAHGESRGLMDFARAGTAIRVINRFIPFTNASVQGLSRTFTGFAENPKGFTKRMVKYAVMPTMVNYFWNRAQGDEVFEEYLQLPIYVRRTFYNFKVGDKWLRIPKPFEVGAYAELFEIATHELLSGDVPSQVEGLAEGNPPLSRDRTKEEFWDFAKAFIPINQDVLAGGPLSPITETMANYDFFRDKAIVSPYEADKNLSLRKGTESASALGQGLQKVTQSFSSGIDARYIDHWIQSQFGDMGRAVQQVSDMAFKKGKVDQSNAKTLNMATGVFMDSPAMNARDVQWVLNKAAGIGIPAEGTVLADALERYRNAKTSEQKQHAAKFLRTLAARARKRASTVLNKMDESDKRYPIRLKALLGK